MEDNIQEGAVHFHSAVVVNEAGLIVEHANHGRLLNTHDRGCIQCGGGRHACQLPDEAAFTKEAARAPES